VSRGTEGLRGDESYDGWTDHELHVTMGTRNYLFTFPIYIYMYVCARVCVCVCMYVPS